MILNRDENVSKIRDDTASSSNSGKVGLGSDADVSFESDNTYATTMLLQAVTQLLVD